MCQHFGRYGQTAEVSSRVFFSPLFFKEWNIMKWNIRYITKIVPWKLIPWNLPGLKKKRQKSDQERTSTQRHFRIWQVVRRSIFNSIKTYCNLWNGILVISCVLSYYITNQFYRVLWIICLISGAPSSMNKNLHIDNKWVKSIYWKKICMMNIISYLPCFNVLWLLGLSSEFYPWGLLLD